DLTVEETKRRLAEGDYDLVDVREPWEYQLGHLPGARLVPLNTLLIQAQRNRESERGTELGGGAGGMRGRASQLSPAWDRRNT
ncbi:MAG TPA: rhodanese-like domain-containing protein, partial [Chloroflexota bacterium]|nr:rhodanese-like domain-containing protein [Chloroflexota bacterium]